MGEIGWIGLELPLDREPEAPRSPGWRVHVLSALGPADQALDHWIALRSATRQGMPNPEQPDRGDLVARQVVDDVLIALDKTGRWIGVIELRAHHNLDCLFIQYTGVLPDFRGRGVATALKHAAATMGKGRGFGYIRTVHHPDNHIALAMNQRLGYRQATGSLPAPE